jgi:hypothetical protein
MAGKARQGGAKGAFLHWTTHVMTGASVGYLIGRPVPAAIAGFAGHLALDTFPHNDPESDVPYVVDSAAGAVILIAIATSRRIRAADPHHAALWGAIGAGVPDLELLAKLVTVVHQEDYLYPTHNGLIPHRHMRASWSTLSQVALIGVTLGLALWKRSRFRRASGNAAHAV